MESIEIIIAALSFGLSFVFALGGVGSALVLIPSLAWLGIPLNLARTTALFVNAVSMAGATYSNIKEKRLDFRLGVPIIVASVVLAPVGAWVGLLIPTRVVLMAFIGFLAFSGTMMLFSRDRNTLTNTVKIGPCSGLCWWEWQQDSFPGCSVWVEAG